MRIFEVAVGDTVGAAAQAAVSYADNIATREWKSVAIRSIHRDYAAFVLARVVRDEAEIAARCAKSLGLAVHLGPLEYGGDYPGVDQGPAYAWRVISTRRPSGDGGVPEEGTVQVGTA